MKFNYKKKKSEEYNENIFIDYCGDKIEEIEINNILATNAVIFTKHRIYIPNTLLNITNNSIKIRFKNRYSYTSHGF